MKHEHSITVQDLKHRLEHVCAQDDHLKAQRDALWEQYQRVEEKLRRVQAERGELTRAIKTIENVILPVKPEEEYNEHDKH